MESLPYGRLRAPQRRLQGGQRQLVHAQRTGERVPPEPFDQVAAAEQQTGLRTAEQLVAARGDEVGADPQHARGVGLLRQERITVEQPRTDVDDHGHAQPGQLGHLDRAGEALDPEVRRVDLEHEPRLRPDRVPIVGQGGAVGRAHFA